MNKFNKKTIIMTGGAGFIGSNFIKKICCNSEIKKNYNFVIIDALTYAGFFPTIEDDIINNEHLSFHQINIRDQSSLWDLLDTYQSQSPSQSPINGIIHFAAESHVDRSIKNPNIFIDTNVIGTLNLLNYSLKLKLKNEHFRYLQVSTDEVYGHLNENDPAFEETTPLQPNSPYSASKASADLLVRSFVKTFHLPAIITRCSNNYGPYQFPEKFIPLMIHNAWNNLPLPIYGQGLNIRDWIHVDDHNQGIWQAFLKGKVGEIYNFGGDAERRNIEIAKNILKVLGKSEKLLTFVEDRLGHDFRYAINFSKAQKELDWTPQKDFNEGITETINWYLENQNWVNLVKQRQEQSE